MTNLLVAFVQIGLYIVAMKTPLERSVEIAGGQSSLARKIGVAQGHVWHWLNRSNSVPSEYVIQISKSVNWKVTPHELRPDIYPNPTDALPASVDSNDVSAYHQDQHSSKESIA